MLGFLRVLWRRTEGAQAIEFALVCIPLLIITIGIIEFSFALFQWNSAEKATQMGVRTAVVSSPVATGLNTFDGKTGGNEYGDEPPADFAATAGSPIVCTGNGTTGTCTNVQSGTYGGAYAAAAHTRIVDKMRTIFPRVTAQNVAVEYRFMDLGFVGRCGPVPSVTVRLENMSFDFIVINSLLTLVAGGGGLGSTMALPSFTATMVGEDLNTQGTTVCP